MKLAVSGWYPYRHQATAFQQLIGAPVLEQVALDTVSNALTNAVIGPYIALLPEDDTLPLLGLPAMTEYFHRSHPEKQLFPEDVIQRGHARAFATMMEERFTRFCIADIGSNPDFDRPTWNSASNAPELILTTPPDLTGLVTISESLGYPYLAGDKPSLADALLAAFWWTLEDQGKVAELADFDWLRTWHAHACNGQPFRREG